MSGAGGQLWFSATELAAHKLPGLSAAKRKINERAEAERWSLRTAADGSPLARKRDGRGGGTEYHVTLLPPSARLALVKAGLVEADPDSASNVSKLPATGSGQLWAWYDRQPSKSKAAAEERAAAVDAIERMMREGLTRSAAVSTVAAQTGTGSSTLFNWLKLVAGCAPHDRLPNLCPRYAGGGREVEIDPELWHEYKSNYLRSARPPHSTVYRDTKALAAARGLDLPNPKTLQRKFEREVDPAVVTAMRNGSEAIRAMLPPQKRHLRDLAAMQLVNIDGHKWDVRVRFPDGTVGRPMMVAIQDVFSRRFLSWRIGKSESATLSRLVFADLFRDHGIPAECLLDNGRAFASKWITGGAANRYRFSINPDDPLGLLPQLGIEVHWALPYRGQSKPIERGFRDFCSDISKKPAFARAYVGNSIANKPHDDDGKSAIDLDIFKAIIADGIAAHNARPGRRTDTASGTDSFDDVFARSIAAGAPVGRASPEQMRLALLTADRVFADRKTGLITLHGNRYWSPELSRYAAERLTVRFDPENLHGEIHAYRATGEFIATVPVMEAVGFLDHDAAKDRARLEADHRRTVRRAVELEDLLSPNELAERQARLIPGMPEPADVRVIRPVRVRGGGAAAAAIEFAPDLINFNDRFARAAARLSVVE